TIQSALHALESKKNGIDVERARIETRTEGLRNEMREELADRLNAILENVPTTADRNAEQTRSEMLKIKQQLELIGGIDEETIKEYEETEERFTFLNTQVPDLQEAIKSTEKIIDELDERIRKQSA